MRVVLRASLAGVSAVVVAMVVVLVAAMTFAFVALASTTVLIMGGTGHPLATPPDTVPYVRQYMGQAVDNFISPASTASAPTGIPSGPYNSVAVITPEEDWPNYGRLPIAESVRQGQAALHSCLTTNVCDYNTDMGSTAPSLTDTFVVFGFSQSAVIAMLEKDRLAAEYAEGEGPKVSFVVIGGPRPNGGLAARDTTGIATFLLFGRWPGSMTAPFRTDTHYSTVNIALQYDGFSDFPLNPLNMLATLNAYMGVLLLHAAYGSYSLSDPSVLDQGQYGDTRYYLMSSDVLPLLKPVQYIPIIGPALADSWDPVLRVIVESAYDRSISPGVTTPFNVFYFEDPIRLAANIIAAVPVGMDNGIETLFGVRPLGTKRPGPYGVGGWDTKPSATDPTAVSVSSSVATSDSLVGAGAEGADSGEAPLLSLTRGDSDSDSEDFAVPESPDTSLGDSVTDDSLPQDDDFAEADATTSLMSTDSPSTEIDPEPTRSTLNSTTNGLLNKFMPHKALSPDANDSSPVDSPNSISDDEGSAESSSSASGSDETADRGTPAGAGV